MINTEQLLDWLVKLDVAFYVATKEVDYDPKCNSHFYLKGSPERFTSKDIIDIYNNNASDEINKNWQYANADHANYNKRH